MADSAADVFSSSQVLGREDNTLSLEGNINSENENDKTVKMLRMDNVTTEPEEESQKETEFKSEEMENFIHSIIKKIIQDMIL